jgi:WhiB family redox-sensing transcriptional regulator
MEVIVHPSAAEEPLPEELSWMLEANCQGLDPAIFEVDSTVRSKNLGRICAGCVHQELCLDYALDNHINTGYLGDMTAHERYRLGRARALEGALCSVQERIEVEVWPSRSQNGIIVRTLSLHK